MSEIPRCTQSCWEPLPGAVVRAWVTPPTWDTADGWVTLLLHGRQKVIRHEVTEWGGRRWVITQVDGNESTASYIPVDAVNLVEVPVEQGALF